MKFILWGIFGLLIAALFALLTQQLWNWLVPQLFAGPVISFWQAAGLLILSKILFSGFGGKRHCGSSHYPYWKNRLHEKFSTMTPEEREAFKKKMKDKWCSFDQTRRPGESSDSND